MSFLPVLGAEMLPASSFRNTRWGRPGRPVAPANGPCGKGLRNYVRIDFSYEVIRIVDRHSKAKGRPSRNAGERGLPAAAD